MTIYQNSPSDYIWHQKWWRFRYRQAEIVVCTGLGAWEQDDFYHLSTNWKKHDLKNIPAWFAEWGHDVARTGGASKYLIGQIISQKGRRHSMNYLCYFTLLSTKFPTIHHWTANKGMSWGLMTYEQLMNACAIVWRVFPCRKYGRLRWEVKRAAAFLFYKHGPIDHRGLTIVLDLELDAALREQFVFGAKPKIWKPRFKSEMAKLFKKAGF